MAETILVTGGAGYIGSHTVVELLENGKEVVVVDNLLNSHVESLRRVEQLTGKSVTFYQIDCCDSDALSEVFNKHEVSGVIHFAGLKAVGESVAQPLRYYRNNLDSTLSLCETMAKHGVKTLVFSSSATVYDPAASPPWAEDSTTGGDIPSPYGKTKYMIEHILQDIAKADLDWKVTILRYFNPVGAHPSGQIGEDPNDIPNNLMPFVSQVAVGKRDTLHIFGNDYDTPDGTCIRDYIHVVDLAKGHLAALAHAAQPGQPAIYNLGTGKGVSVMEVVKAFESAAGKPVPYVIDPRRPGDLAKFYADSSKASQELGWKAEKSIEDACRDAWRWQSQNPDGYATKK